MACARDHGNRHAFDTRKYGLGAPLHFVHPRHRQARRIDAIDTAGGKHIAHRDIRIGGHKAQLQRVGIARGFAIGHTARAGAYIDYRNRMVAVGDQGHFAGHGENARYLAYDAKLINDGRGQMHTLALAFVQHHFTGVGVGGVIDHLGGQRAGPLAFLQIQNAAQSLVFQNQLLVLLGALALLGQLLAQLTQRRFIAEHAVHALVGLLG